jgi:hypothetical protein
MVYIQIVDVLIELANIVWEKYGTKNHVIGQIINGYFSSQELDAAKRIKKRRCCFLRHSA